MGEGEAPGRERQGGGQAQGGRKLGMGRTRRQRGYGAWWGRPAAAVGATRPLDATRVGQRRLVALEMTGGRRSAPPWPRPWGRPQPSQRRRAVGGIKNPVRGAPALSGGWAMGGGKGRQGAAHRHCRRGRGVPTARGQHSWGGDGRGRATLPEPAGGAPVSPPPARPPPLLPHPAHPGDPGGGAAGPPNHCPLPHVAGRRLAQALFAPPPLRCRWSLGGQSRSGAT